MFAYLVIHPNGLTFFQYPLEKMQIGSSVIDEVLLFSGMFTALNIFSSETLGDSIKSIDFGNVIASFSRDKQENLHVFFTEKEIHVDIRTRIHKELTILFGSVLGQYFYDKRFSFQVWPIPKNLTRSIFDPFFNYWRKKMNQNKLK